MAVRRSFSVSHPPAKVLAGVATAGENLDYEVRRVDPDRGLVVLASSWTREAASLGYIVTVRVREEDARVRVDVDVTPRVGFWASHAAGERVDAIGEQLRHVLKAPKARIRRPEQAGRPDRPFGYRPELVAAAWAILSVAVFGLFAGGWWWVAGAAGAIGGLLLVRPIGGRPWSTAVVLAGLLSVPFGLLGLGFRREVLCQAYWRGRIGGA